MKIAFFCDAYKPTRNGVAVSASTTAEELRRRGHEVIIFAPQYRGHLDTNHETIVRFPAMQWFRAKDFALALPILSSPLVMPVLRAQERFFAAQNFDVIHTHSPFTIGTIGARWGRKYQIPAVFTFHTLYHRYLHYAPLPLWYSRPYTVKRVRRHSRFCRHVIAPSQALARRMKYFCPDLPISVVPTGVPLENFSGGNGKSVRIRWKIAPDEIVLLYVGRLVREKSLDFLLRALAPLLGSQQGPRTRLMLVGGGPAQRELSALAAQLNVADDVIFTGFADSPQIPDFLAAGDIFVFASRSETQGVSISEALVSGLPCVVVGAMGAAEAVTNGENGFIVPPDEAIFRARVQNLLENRDLRCQMSKMARQAAPQLSLSHNVDELEKIYQSVL